MMTLLVCGSREWRDRDVVDDALTDAVREWGVTLLVQGGARGVDQMAKEYAALVDLKYHTVPADWKKHGKAAGPIRNEKMLRQSNPDVCLAFSAIPITRGTLDMVTRCLRAGVPTYLVTPDSTRTQLDREQPCIPNSAVEEAS